MPYVVTPLAPKGSAPSLSQLLGGELAHSAHKIRRYPGTRTVLQDSVSESLYRPEDIRRLISLLESFSNVAASYPQQLGGQYRTFMIPKHSGGMRTICEPKPRLYADQVSLRELLEQEFAASHHTTAFAYCKGRSIKHCIQRHQANKSKWFLKIDFEDFFGNTSQEFVMRQLQNIAPFSEVLKDPAGKKRLENALRICFLHDGLPQGTPISPMLTNLVMIPFDHEINKRLHERGFVYTRYADDIQISHREKFNHIRILGIVNSTLRDLNMPYHIKPTKTRFGSSSGRNYNLGLMLNKDNRITIGHKKHKEMKARLHSFAMAVKNNDRWTLEEAQKLMGRYAYFESIEPKTAQYVVKHLSDKLGIDILKELSRSVSVHEELTPQQRWARFSMDTGFLRAM